MLHRNNVYWKYCLIGITYTLPHRNNVYYSGRNNVYGVIGITYTIVEPRYLCRWAWDRPGVKIRDFPFRLTKRVYVIPMRPYTLFRCARIRYSDDRFYCKYTLFRWGKSIRYSDCMFGHFCIVSENHKKSVYVIPLPHFLKLFLHKLCRKMAYTLFQWRKYTLFRIRYSDGILVYVIPYTLFRWRFSIRYSVYVIPMAF